MDGAKGSQPTEVVSLQRFPPKAPSQFHKVVVVVVVVVVESQVGSVNELLFFQQPRLNDNDGFSKSRRECHVL